MSEFPCEARVVAIREEAEDVFSFELIGSSGGDLPEWQPGAHIDIELPNGIVRQYSLCGDPADLSRYRIGVLKVLDGRGGSRSMHDLTVGTGVRILAVRNLFPLQPDDEYLFIAGGIGITPILPMVKQTVRAGCRTILVYAVRHSGRGAFVRELEEVLGTEGGFQLHIEERDGRLDLAGLLGQHPNAAVYACGPAGMLDALVQLYSAHDKADVLHLERFTPIQPVIEGEDQTSDAVAVCSRSGVTVPLQPSLSVLESLRGAGIEIPSSCEQGICGTCELRVLDGEIDHQDLLLTEQERAEGRMLVCVSRPRGTEIVLDI